ncbi:Pyridoxine/pyridoxamine 5'-phosphate oxidase [Halomicronema hongdechloris C2206]|uniref:Pyridoxine/pyridoxamine 5'-phosphate oxidase n=1 Tax=Halomicronema hongdechloris C2206 TaxID=1641165 RepID=A0A1Z3HJ55_9CYAN|nr:pyridoxamine 5'-phosphate oxidase [Halomicronema hongdechloris]ASC70323.1 Pyridoxine/pyridoxamine 5'-phosphate oxidase [Halomicronema hongdechloris C2206]
MDIAALRREYSQRGLQRTDLAADPLQQFQRWFQEACDAELLEPNAMVVATVAADGMPYQRTVLLKYFDPQGFVFFTNYGSRKAQQLQHNPKVSLLFPWYGLERQLHITGMATKISTMESWRYFSSRPRGSQIGAWVSQQSQVISSRQLLEAQFDHMQQKFKQGQIPLPDFWGGYRVVPDSFEFWQGRSNRLHDRFLYTRHQDGWDIQRLSP